ncbi:ABC transporter substrate-binding protein [Actinomycetospora sp. NBRC 106375]|uniref:MCE family protein n=1 Tax=Actinomycetospora sp. NBRC 106375 TaxID=3032207 RepID=UPI00249FE3E7|nr:MCE family protein [Actinomycetospora sp. NBRC 106375]GLZ44657.1 ABC transporter substrate-binding protein [Actinomycetospora sp. NBRC 106375]
MIGTRTLRLVALFAVISIVGIGYVSLRYVGADSLIGLGPYVVKVELADSGGIFPDASVSYRGVEIGKVGDMRVTPQGLEVDLEIENDSPDVPASATAVIANRSAVGEQFVDLEPPSDAGPYLEDGSIIPQERTRTPVPVDQLLADLNALATSVPLPELRTTVDELYKAFDRAGPDLQRLLDGTNALIPDAIRNLPQFTQLLRDGRIVLNTQASLGPQIISFSRDLQLFTAQLKADDPNLRRLVNSAPPAARELEGLIRDVGPDLSRTIANLLTVTRIIQPRLAGVEQVLVTYPALSAAAPTVVPGDGRVHFGLVLNIADPPYCRNGYLTPDNGWRPATAKDFIPMDTSVRCNEAPPVDVRGSQNVGPAPFNSSNPGGPAASGGSGQQQNDQQDTTALASLPAGGVLAGSGRGAPPVIIPGLGTD